MKTGQLVRPGGKTHRVGGGNEKPDAGICRVGLVKVKVGAPTIGAETLNMCARMPGARINHACHCAQAAFLLAGFLAVLLPGAPLLASMKSSTSGRMLLRQDLPAKIP